MGLEYEFFNTGDRVNPGPPTPSTKKSYGGKMNFGDTRTEQDKHLQEEGWGSCFATEQQQDYCKFLERRIKDGYVCKGKIHLGAGQIHHLMKQYGKDDG